jgi:predicted transcriptional regulator
MMRQGLFQGNGFHTSCDINHCLLHILLDKHQFKMNVSCREAQNAFSANLRLQIIEWAFGKRMTPAERLRKHQRALEKTQRELDRERMKLENQEKKLIAQIKQSAKNGQMGAAKIQAKDLVRTRR